VDVKKLQKAVEEKSLEAIRRAFDGGGGEALRDRLRSR
jgi:hypothetical protein